MQPSHEPRVDVASNARARSALPVIESTHVRRAFSRPSTPKAHAVACVCEHPGRSCSHARPAAIHARDRLERAVSRAAATQAGSLLHAALCAATPEGAAHSHPTASAVDASWAARRGAGQCGWRADARQHGPFMTTGCALHPRASGLARRGRNAACGCAGCIRAWARRHWCAPALSVRGQPLPAVARFQLGQAPGHP